MDNLLIFSDGGARGNPGPAAIGYAIQDISGKTLSQAGLKIGEATNNVAEYKGIIMALERAATFDNVENISIQAFLDSKLVVEQLSGRWRIKEAHLKKLAEEVKGLERKFKKVVYKHIPREKNSLADSLLNQALDS